MRYDGQFWDLYPLPNGSNIRSLYFSKNEQLLFAGAFNSFGYFKNDSIGELEYVSLIELVPEEKRNFGDIWKIHEGPWGIMFQSFEGLYILQDDEIKVVDPRSFFHFSYYVNGILYLFDRENGLMEYRNGFLRKLPKRFMRQITVWNYSNY